MSLDNFTQVTTVNPRNSSADVSYSTKTQKFSVSEDLYNRLELADKGFALYISNDEKRIALALVPNEEASIMRGRRGSTKGRQFTAAALVTAMNEFMPNVNNFSLQHMASNAGVEYYEVLPEGESRSVTATDTSEEDSNAETEDFTSEEELNDGNGDLVSSHSEEDLPY